MIPNMDERMYWLGFSVFPGIGPIKFKLLIDTFKTAQKAWNASPLDLKLVLGDSLITKFEKFRAAFSISDYAKRLKEEKVSFITLLDEGYPSLLKQIQKPPFVLYARGNTKVLLESDRLLAVVGTRKITQYGTEVTKLIVSELVENGFIIVSGLAFGVDAVAHKTAIDMGGKTIAVLGCGVDCCTPAVNQNLYNKIIEDGGVILSELPLAHPPTKGSFPARNRIIAGLSNAVVVTEGAEDSGALITAGYGFKNKRTVFAVPGPITSPLSKGPYKLISKGAKLVTSAKNILEDLKSEIRISKFETNLSADRQDSKSQNTKKQKGTPEEEKILKLLENESLHFDELVRKTGISSSKIGSIISLMEIKGIIKNSGNGMLSI